jgi:hypothetical protein
MAQEQRIGEGGVKRNQPTNYLQPWAPERLNQLGQTPRLMPGGGQQAPLVDLITCLPTFHRTP